MDGQPYAAKLQEAGKEGLASKEFDAVWSDLAATDNVGFGAAQERFLLHDVGADVTAFFDAANVPAEARTDTDLYDVAIGTLNQYGALADGMASTLATQIATMEVPSADAIGAALQDIKATKVESHFKSSPNAWNGIRERIAREKAIFTP